MPKNKPPFDPIQIKPLTGPLDTESLPENMEPGSYRWVENAAALSSSRACRLPGYQKLYTEMQPYNNHDLHDQLFAYTRQPGQLLFEAVSTSGVHRLIAATQSRIYVLDDSLGNWRVLSDALGGNPESTCSQIRWHAAQVEDTIIFTNGQDKPVYWTFDGPAISDDQSVSLLSDLESLNISRVGSVFAWKGVMFYGNLVADGVRVNNRVLWSDFKKPLSVIPSSSSIAGYQDLGSNESILAFAPLDDSLLIYTTQSIWECQVGDQAAGAAFTFRRRYTEPNGNATLAYRNTLIVTGSDHIYWGRDGVYAYNLYAPAPVRTIWLNKACGFIFDEIDPTLCNTHVGAWNPLRQEAWFSWAAVGETCPSRSIVISVGYQFSSVVNRGFTAFGVYRPSGSTSVLDYITDHCICDPDGTNIITDLSPLTGGRCTEVDPVVCDNVYNSLYTTITSDIVGFPASIEAGDQNEFDEGSLYAALKDITISDLCNSELNNGLCNTTAKFLMFSAFDASIKQFGGQYAHEHASSHNACGTYLQSGYSMIFRSGPIDFGEPSLGKYVKRFLVENSATVQTTATMLNARLGFSRQASDPNQQVCPIIWGSLPPKALACASPKSEATHKSNHTQPYLAIEWPVYLGGHFIYWEISVTGTGGESCYSSVTLDVGARPQARI